MKLFIITQSVDSTHSALGFFVEWIRSFRRHPAVSSVDVASFDQSSEKIEDVSIHRIVKKDRWGRMREMCELLHSTEWDVLFVHMTPIWCIVCWPIVFVKRKKMVLWYTHGSSSLSLRIACLLANEIYTATIDAFPFKSSRVYAVGHGISPAFISTQRSASDAYRFLFVGRRSPRKRVIETIELFARVHVLQPNATLDCVGERMDDVYELEIDQTIKRLKLESVVHLLGPVVASETPRIFASHDLLLHLSATGSLDKVAIEALASGCALFSTNPATKEGLGREWFWEGALDDQAAVEAIKRAQEDVSEAQRASIASRYDLSSLIDRLCKSMSLLVK